MDALIKPSLMSRISLIISVLYLTNVESAPEPYCLKTFNHSDCGMPRTAVFHYYKPGSRCEIVYWSGCPTANMFANEYQCSHHCIMRLNEHSEPPERNQTQDKTLIDNLNELKPEVLKEVDEVLNDVVEATQSHEKLVKMASSEDMPTETVEAEEEEPEEDDGPQPNAPDPLEMREEEVEFG